MSATNDNTTPDAQPLTRADVDRWRAEADDFFVAIRRELSCLTGAAPPPSKPRGTQPGLPAMDSMSSPPAESTSPVSKAPVSTPPPATKPAATSPAATSPAATIQPAETLSPFPAVPKSPAPNESLLPADADGISAESQLAQDVQSLAAELPLEISGPPATPNGDESCDNVDRLAQLKKRIADKLAEQDSEPTDSPDHPMQ